MGSAFASGQTLANQAIGQYNQNAANFTAQQNAAAAKSQMWSQGASLATAGAKSDMAADLDTWLSEG
jgi:hypothetical protein